jgi:hypothetical protein
MPFTVTPITTASVNHGGASSVTTSSFNVSAGWVYVAGIDANFIGTVEDSLGNSYDRTVAASIISGYSSLFCFYYETAQTGITVTYTTTGTNGCGISLISITGSNGTEDYQVANDANGSSASPSVPGAGSPLQAGELFIGFVGWAGVSPPTFTQAGGWSSAFSAVSFSGTSSDTWELNGGYLVNSGSSNQTYNPSLSGSAVWGAGIDAVQPLASVDLPSCGVFCLP